MAARSLLLLLPVIAMSMMDAKAQDLPTKSAQDEIEAEAKGLMEDLPALVTEADDDVAPAGEALDLSVEKTKGALDRARRKQERWAKLARQGVLSRAEAETCVVEVANAQANHERARVSHLRAQLTGIQQRVAKGETSPDLAAAAGSALASALQSCAGAEKQAREARLNHARVNLDRQRKLFASGLVPRVHLQRAEANLRKMEADGQGTVSVK